MDSIQRQGLFTPHGEKSRLNGSLRDEIPNRALRLMELGEPKLKNLDAASNASRGPVKAVGKGARREKAEISSRP